MRCGPFCAVAVAPAPLRAVIRLIIHWRMPCSASPIKPAAHAHLTEKLPNIYYQHREETEREREREIKREGKLERERKKGEGERDRERVSTFAYEKKLVACAHWSR